MWEPQPKGYQGVRSFFEGTVDRFEHTSEGILAWLRDVRAVHGPPANVVVMNVGDCVYPFQVGARYFIDGVRHGSRTMRTSTCSLTAPIEKAAQHLDYLATLSGPGKGARVFGQARSMMPLDRNAPLPGARLVLTGPVTRTTTTGRDGSFSFERLPPGNYRLHADVDPSQHPTGFGDEFTLPNGYACHESHVFRTRLQ